MLKNSGVKSGEVVLFVVGAGVTGADVTDLMSMLLMMFKSSEGGVFAGGGMLLKLVIPGGVSASGIVSGSGCVCFCGSGVRQHCPIITAGK